MRWPLLNWGDKLKNIQNEEWLDSLTDDLEKNLFDLNSFVISVFCKRVGFIAEKMKEGKTDFKTASEYAVEDMAKIKKAVKESGKYGLKEIGRIFDKLAAANVDFSNDFYEYRNMPKIEDYTKNPALKPLVEDMKKTTKEGFRNISKTTALKLIDKDGNYHSIRESYVRLIDNAVEAVKLGEQDFYTVMRSQIRQLAKSGLRNVYFENEGKRPYSRRIDSQVRMNVQDGIRQLNHQMQEQVGKEFGANGWELSVHSLCAPDHQHIQGKQYSKREYEKLNRRLDRPIGELGCRHYAMPIILGVSKPVYSEKELKEYIDRSNQKVEYKGKEYTRYEASQVQRNYETAIKQARMEQGAARDSKDTEQEARKKNQVKELTADYNRFSKAVGLTPRPERTKI